jgi:hypothetical protein
MTLAARTESRVKQLRFYEGKPCKRCGGTLRYTSTAGCVTCILSGMYRKPKVVTNEQS